MNEFCKNFVKDPIFVVFFVIACIFSIFFLKTIWKDLSDSDRMFLPIAVLIFIMLVTGGLMMGIVVGESLK